MNDPLMPWSSTIAVADTDEAPPDPPVWRPGESLEQYERALHRWLREMVAWAHRHRHHPHHLRATAVRLSIGGQMAAVTISVDAAGEKATADWVDDKGDVTTAPDGASITYVSSDSSVLDVATDWSLTLNKAGTATITATAVDTTGSPLANFGVATVDVTLTPGPAASLEISVNP